MIAEFPPDQEAGLAPDDVLVERARVLSAVHAYLRHAEHDTWSGVDDTGLRLVIRRLLALRWAYRQGRVTS